MPDFYCYRPWAFFYLRSTGVLIRFKGVCGIYGVVFHRYILEDILTVLLLHLYNNTLV